MSEITCIDFHIIQFLFHFFCHVCIVVNYFIFVLFYATVGTRQTLCNHQFVYCLPVDREKSRRESTLYRKQLKIHLFRQYNTRSCISMALHTSFFHNLLLTFAKSVEKRERVQIMYSSRFFCVFILSTMLNVHICCSAYLLTWFFVTANHWNAISSLQCITYMSRRIFYFLLVMMILQWFLSTGHNRQPMAL